MISIINSNQKAPKTNPWKIATFVSGASLLVAGYLGAQMVSNASPEQNRSASFLAQPSATADPNISPTPLPRIRGNKSSGIFHTPSCPNYRDISPWNIEYFHTVQEAIKAGYRRARNC